MASELILEREREKKKTNISHRAKTYSTFITLGGVLGVRGGCGVEGRVADGRRGVEGGSGERGGGRGIGTGRGVGGGRGVWGNSSLGPTTGSSWPVSSSVGKHKGTDVNTLELNTFVSVALLDIL